MKLICAPVIRKPLEVMGVAGMTDFVRIYIATELNKDEYRTTLRHEQGHVWSGHNRRAPKGADDETWRIACEMEIARTIYDQADIDNIKAPRSRLAGVYVPDSIPGMPGHITLAEDIYEWLMEHPDDVPKMAMCVICKAPPEGKAEEKTPEAIGSAQEARARLDEEEMKGKSQAAVESAYAALKSRTPSLSCAVDAALRVRIERERTHRRPSRRSADDSVILAGAVSKPRPPLVEIFIDRSGSFTPQKTAKAEIKLKEILQRYGSTIASDVWFFGNGKLSEVDYGGGGDTPYHLIPHHLERTKPKLAIIITDDDPVNKCVLPIDKTTSVLCIPIECAMTNLARALNGIDVKA
ncbi:hypothetical protein FHW69_001640 [Luteibacter sp. Sphag1AF]|uniref:hypothetical protein n=1 Tax=Luteibacter sp. Sphag1AF TaxID=2587031 RepID=UPI00161F017A|nr:hypothetical protein [Luteibacter sp. Sphag1AF]MBB3227039.1 hypothetical protein [Luteibacter sp. Sphag1AF]